MNDILRTFRLGVINLLGVTVPGLILLFLLFFGFLFPVVLALQNVATQRMTAHSTQVGAAAVNQATNQPAAQQQTATTGQRGVLLFVDLIASSGTNQLVLNLTNSPSAVIETQEISFAELPPIGRLDPSAAAAATIVILAYVIGYVFRLSTPDELDKKSGNLVLEKMVTTTPAAKLKKTFGRIKRVVIKGFWATEMNLSGVSEEARNAAELDHWPYHGEQGNTYPYFHFRDYLEHREHEQLLQYVHWNKDMRSKTLVNEMKLKTLHLNSELSSINESNEAHIRMLFGTWMACRFGFWLATLGFAVSLIGYWGLRSEPRLPTSTG